MIPIIGILIYLWLTLKAVRILNGRKAPRKYLVLLVLLNILFWFLAAWNWHQGYVADNNGTSGDSWSMAVFLVVLLATYGYYLYLYSRYRRPAKK